MKVSPPTSNPKLVKKSSAQRLRNKFLGPPRSKTVSSERQSSEGEASSLLPPVMGAIYEEKVMSRVEGLRSSEDEIFKEKSDFDFDDEDGGSPQLLLITEPATYLNISKDSPMEPRHDLSPLPRPEFRPGESLPPISIARMRGEARAHLDGEKEATGLPIPEMIAIAQKWQHVEFFNVPGKSGIGKSKMLELIYSEIKHRIQTGETFPEGNLESSLSLLGLDLLPHSFDDNPPIEEPHSEILAHYTDDYNELMSADFSTAIQTLADKIGKPEDFDEWYAFLDMYYQGQLNVHNLPITPPRVWSHSFLPALHPIGEALRVSTCHPYQQIWNSLDLQKNLEAALIKMMLLLDTEYFSFSIFDDREEVVVLGNMYDKDNIPRVSSLAAHAMYATDQLLVVLDTVEDWRFQHNEHVLSSPSIRFFAAAPVINEASEALGVLLVASKNARYSFNVHQRQKLVNMGQQIMKEIKKTCLLFKGNGYRDTLVSPEDARKRPGSIDRSSNVPHCGHIRQESIVDHTLIPGALNIFKPQEQTSPLTVDPSPGLDMDHFPSVHYYQQFGDVVGNDSGLTFMSHNTTDASSSGRPYSSSTNSFFMNPSASPQKFPNQTIEEEDEMSERGFTKHEDAADDDHNYTHMAERMRNSSISNLSASDQRSSCSTIQTYECQATGSTAHDTIEGRRHRTTPSGLPRTMDDRERSSSSLIASSEIPSRSKDRMSSFSSNKSDLSSKAALEIDQLCKGLKSDMQYDVVYVTEVLSGKQGRILGGKAPHNVTTIDPSFLSNVLRQDRVEPWIAEQSSSAENTLTTGDMIFIHSDDSVNNSEDRSSGLVGICLRTLAPREKRVRSRDLIRLSKFKADVKKTVAPPTAPAPTRRSTGNRNVSYPANEAKEVTVPGSPYHY